VAVVSSSAGAPVAAIETFYQLISEHRFADAAALWSPRLQSQDDPATYINQRFAGTRSVTVLSDTLDSADPATGTAVVGVQLLETTASGARLTWTGTWRLVLGPSGWLLDQPDFGPASQALQSVKPGKNKHDPADGSKPPKAAHPEHGPPAKPGHDGGDEGNGN
jgi:hypothetical protein